MKQKPFSFEISVVAFDTKSVRTTSINAAHWMANLAGESPACEPDAGLNWYAPPIEGTEIVLVSEPVLMEAQALLAGCERCEGQAEIAFDYLLDAVTGCDPSETEYLMYRPANCPQCFSPVSEKTLVISR